MSDAETRTNAASLVRTRQCRSYRAMGAADPSKLGHHQTLHKRSTKTKDDGNMNAYETPYASCYTSLSSLVSRPISAKLRRARRSAISNPRRMMQGGQRSRLLKLRQPSACCSWTRASWIIFPAYADSALASHMSQMNKYEVILIALTYTAFQIMEMNLP